jgi:hypothetical protein
MRRLIFCSAFVLAVSLLPARASYSLFDSGESETKKSFLKNLLGPRAGEFSYDKRMIAAAEIAASRAYSSSRYSCWRYVKEALVSAHVIDSYPKTRYAKEAASELQSSFGFQKLPVQDPYKAPTGAVLVYGGTGPGHIELRSPLGFVSDFISPKPSNLPLIGVFVKPKS